MENIPGVHSVTVNATLPPIAKPWIFNAERTGDKIAISGNYASEASRELLQSAAQAAVPGAKIEDNRTLARGAPQDADLLASYVVAQLAGLGDGKIAISDLAVSVSGRASSVDAYENITGALSAGLPAGGSLTALAVEPAIVDPYEFKARKQAEGILLEGYMPDQATRDAVISAAKSSNPGSAIEDATRIAAGVPDGVDWAGATAFALAELGGLSSGSAAISGSDLSIEGRAADSDSFEAIGKALAAELPGGLKLANAAIGQPLISPWTWSLSAKGGAVDLAGFAPDKATAQRNIADARDRFASSLEIRDAQKLGAGAPAGVNDAYAAAIQVASRLADATVAIENSAVRLSGQAFTGTAANEIRAQFASTLPAGWSATVRIAVRATCRICRGSTMPATDHWPCVRDQHPLCFGLVRD